ncbi:hypothetical protein GQ44DRAFT_580049, partial [Phaeosphaeriaceae sp. PMI808]
EHPTRRTIVVILCIFYALLLASAQGYRVGRMAGHKAKTTKVSDVLVFVQGFICTAFLFAIVICTNGLGLSSQAQCHAAIIVCIVMYGTAKSAIALFLLERVHIVRSAFIERLRDPIWVTGAVVTIAGYTGIMGFEFIRPMANLSLDDGKCRIGIQPNASIAILGFDTGLNVALTGIFIWLLQPAFASHVHWPSMHTHRSMKERKTSSVSYLFRWKYHLKRASSVTNVRIMLIRNIIGSVLLLVNTIINNVLYLSWDFANMSHVCQMTCLTEVVLGMFITQWLTMRSALEGGGLDRNPSNRHVSNSSISDRNSPRSRR